MKITLIEPKSKRLNVYQNVKQSFCEAKIWENFVALKGVNEVKKFSA